MSLKQKFVCMVMVCLLGFAGGTLLAGSWDVQSLTNDNQFGVFVPDARPAINSTGVYWVRQPTYDTYNVMRFDGSDITTIGSTTTGEFYLGVGTVGWQNGTSDFYVYNGMSAYNITTGLNIKYPGSFNVGYGQATFSAKDLSDDTYKIYQWNGSSTSVAINKSVVTSLGSDSLAWVAGSNNNELNLRDSEGAVTTFLSSDAYPGQNKSISNPMISGSNIFFNIGNDNYAWDGTDRAGYALIDSVTSLVKMDGDKGIWKSYSEDYRYENLYLYDHSTGQSNLVTTVDRYYGASISGVDISGDKVAWIVRGEYSDLAQATVSDVFVYDGTETVQLTDTPKVRENISIFGDAVVWEETTKLYEVPGLSYIVVTQDQCIIDEDEYICYVDPMDGQQYYIGSYYPSPGEGSSEIMVATYVPEPATMGLVLVGAAGALARRRRR